MVTQLDSVTRHMADWLAPYPPERGGALLGLPRRDLITRFVPDEWAQTTSSTYVPSPQLGECVRSTEAEEGLVLLAMAHRHPDQMNYPSGQDKRSIEAFLSANRHAADYLLPIVTRKTEAAEAADNELSVSSIRISYFLASPNGRAVVVRPARVAELPLRRDLEAIASHFGAVEQPRDFLTWWDGRRWIAGKLILPGDLELLLLVPDQYPDVPPLLLATAPGQATEQIATSWDVALPEEARLLAALSPHFGVRGPFSGHYGVRAALALTVDGDRARRAGWTRRYSADDPATMRRSLVGALRNRSAEHLGDPVSAARVLMFGAGSIGSYMADQFARAKVARITVVDFDEVQPLNLSRTVYDVGDLGESKVSALERHLYNIDPSLDVEPINSSVADLGIARLDELISNADLVIGATDDPRAQHAIDRFAYARGRPAVFCALYEHADAGEVVFTLSPSSSCYTCATAIRHATGLETALGTMNYGSGRLDGQPALACDIQHIASAAVKIGLAQLMRNRGGEHRLVSFLNDALARGATYLMQSTTAAYSFFPIIFGETDGQHAWQSVWMTPARRPDCPTCGPDSERIDPRRIPLATPRGFADATPAS